MEQELQRRGNVPVQELSPPEPEHQWPWPGTPSPAWPCFTDSFLAAAGHVGEGNPSFGSPIPNRAVISLMTWVLPSSIPLPPGKLPSHQPGFIFSGGNLNRLRLGDARCHPQGL